MPGAPWQPHLLKPHGTAAACRRHYRRGEPPCEPCRQAEARRALDRAKPQPTECACGCGRMTQGYGARLRGHYDRRREVA